MPDHSDLPPGDLDTADVEAASTPGATSKDDVIEAEVDRYGKVLLTAAGTLVTEAVRGEVPDGAETC